jgi:hypothetical protein
MNRAACLAAFAIVLTGAQPASADVIERGYIVNIEDKELYFNLGNTTGIEKGSKIRIKRPIELVHPVTRKKVSDWIPVGTAWVTAVGGSLAMAIVDDDLLAQVQVGDIIETLIVREEELDPEPDPVPDPDPEPTPEDDPDSGEPLPEIDPQTAEVLAIWEATSGQSIEARIRAWEDYLEASPESPHAAAIHQDLEVLRTQRESMRPSEISLGERAIGGLDHSAPTRGRDETAIPLVFLIDEPSNLAAAWLHYRAVGDASYKKGTLRVEDDNYLRGEIPADFVGSPGVEYFVEIATHTGNVGTAVGTPDSPQVIDVAKPALTKAFIDRRSRSRISMTTTYLDFATFDGRSANHTDQFVLFEADFLYRIRGRLYGIRSGLGVLNGEGGYKDRVYDDMNPVPKAGFNYGYTEVELRFAHKTALMARLVAGVGREGFGLGVQGRFRLGDEDATNLSVGASNIDQVGFLSEVRMAWNAVERVPLGLAVALTDQPSRGDLGVRLSTDIGYRVTDWVRPTLRISYQARSVVHSGIGAGLGLIFDW